jgi:hypothetical protein
MVLTLQIQFDGWDHYVASVYDGNELLGKATRHHRFDEAIVICADTAALRFPGATAFFIWCGGWSVGEVSVDRMRADAPVLANRLVVLTSVLRRVPHADSAAGYKAK